MELFKFGFDNKEGNTVIQMDMVHQYKGNAIGTATTHDSATGSAASTIGSEGHQQTLAIVPRMILKNVISTNTAGTNKNNPGGGTPNSHTGVIVPYNVIPTPNKGRPNQQQDIDANTATALDRTRGAVTFQIEQSPSGHK
jgi:hypothetical protein